MPDIIQSSWSSQKKFCSKTENITDFCYIAFCKDNRRVCLSKHGSTKWYRSDRIVFAPGLIQFHNRIARCTRDPFWYRQKANFGSFRIW